MVPRVKRLRCSGMAKGDPLSFPSLDKLVDMRERPLSVGPIQGVLAYIAYAELVVWFLFCGPVSYN